MPVHVGHYGALVTRDRLADDGWAQSAALTTRNASTTRGIKPPADPTSNSPPTPQ
jgi:hypothetical protein